MESIAFCCISTGEFHFPNEKAAEIAVRAVREFLETETRIKKVVFNVFKDLDKEIYRRILDQTEQIERLKETLEKSDAVVIGAGAGLSLRQGLPTAGIGLNVIFQISKQYGFADMYSGGEAESGWRNDYLIK